MARLIALVFAVLGAGCLVAVVAASSPLVAALAVVGTGLIAIAATEAS